MSNKKFRAKWGYNRIVVIFYDHVVTRFSLEVLQLQFSLWIMQLQYSTWNLFQAESRRRVNKSDLTIVNGHFNPEVEQLIYLHQNRAPSSEFEFNH